MGPPRRRWVSRISPLSGKRPNYSTTRCTSRAPTPCEPARFVGRLRSGASGYTTGRGPGRVKREPPKGGESHEGRPGDDRGEHLGESAIPRYHQTGTRRGQSIGDPKRRDGGQLAPHDPRTLH